MEVQKHHIYWVIHQESHPNARVETGWRIENNESINALIRNRYSEIMRAPFFAFLKCKTTEPSHKFVNGRKHGSHPRDALSARNHQLMSIEHWTVKIEATRKKADLVVPEVCSEF